MGMSEKLNYRCPAKGDNLGAWTLQHRLGWGGNGEVWAAENAGGNQVAIKLLMKTKTVAYTRFRQEVAVLKLLAGIDGILPILDSDLPLDPDAQRPWYAMPIATPLLQAIADKETRERLRFIAEAAETMAQLHARNIFHRDIKPANLLSFGGKCHIGDFGLVDYPDKTDLTAPMADLGPRWTMAPEVRRKHNKADSAPAI